MRSISAGRCPALPAWSARFRASPSSFSMFSDALPCRNARTSPSVTPSCLRMSSPWKSFKGDDILRQLGVTEGDVLAFLQGKASLNIEKLLGEARKRADQAGKAGQRPAEIDRMVHQL